MVRLPCPGPKEEAEVRSRSACWSLRGWAGSDRQRCLLGTSLVFSPSVAWAIKGGALQGRVGGEQKEGGSGELMEHRIQAERWGVDCSLPASAGHVTLIGEGPPHTPEPPPSQHGAHVSLVPVPCFLCHLVPFNKRSGITLQLRI